MKKFNKITWLGIQNWLGRKLRKTNPHSDAMRSKIWFPRKNIRPYTKPNLDLQKKTTFHFTGMKLKPMKLPRFRYARYFVIPGVVLLIYILFGSPIFVLNKLEVVGTHLVSNQDIEKLVFPRGFRRVNAVVFTGARAKKKLLGLTQISDVSFAKNILTKTLRIEITEHQTSVIWQTAGERFLVNRFGVVYDKAADSSPLMVVEDLKNVPVSINQKIVDPVFLEFVTSFVANLPRKTNITVRRITVPETTFEVEMITADDWRIILDTTKSYEDQLNNLVRVLREMGDDRPREYVDLRIIDKVFWK